ncbi:pitrilysin family protein [Polaromonas sp.]|uniref:M16 family metallopeptidase n=1 Tax=Polaromonas sp. TaxID=1869339 RepID=UPI00286B0032|nr:pitrilysin family protein [Polaromonas sp.]
MTALNFAIKNIATCARNTWATGIIGIFLAFSQGLALAAIPVQHWTQASGAQVYLVESPAIAMLDVQIDFDAGSRRDPPGQAGLASMMAGMLDKGVRATDGAPALDENTLSEAWADLGAQFGASAGSDRLGFSLRSLTDPALLDQAVALAAREIAEPAFPEAVWQRERQRVQAALKESYTRPGNVAGRAYAQAVYGSHPYGYETTADSLARIGVADLRALHAASVVACRARISLVGAVTRQQADALAARLLARLPQVACAGLPPLPAVAEVAPLAAPLEKRIPFDAAQAQVLIGQPGFKRSDPDYFALTVGNYILGGGGFVSRLSSEVREKRGLTYGVSSSFSPGLHAGSFTVSLQTRPDQAAQSVELVRQLVKDFVANGPTEAELKAAKDNLVGGFALRIDSNRKLLDNVAGIAWNQLPLDYLDTWTQQVNRVTVADIKAAFARKLQPEKMVTVILGAAP